jgi:hypothetical protein
MGGRVTLTNGRVEATTDNFAVEHYHGTHRNFTEALGRTRQRQRFTHEIFVIHRHGLYQAVSVATDLLDAAAPDLGNDDAVVLHKYPVVLY